MMQTATFAKRRQNADLRRGIHPETFVSDCINSRESLKTSIRSLHGEAILGSVNVFTKLRTSLHIQLCSLAFLKRCRDHQVVPKCCQLKNPWPSSSQAKGILREASRRLVRERIAATKRNIAETSRKLFGLHLSLSNSLEPDLWRTLDRVTHEQAVRSAEARTRKQKEKYDKINPVQPLALTHTVKNLSSHVLSPSEVAVLSRGHNFAVTPNSIPTEEIISEIETAIFHLPPEASNDVRNRTANILHKAKLPRQNLSREDRLALRSLRRNDNILILPADKGNATVVMDKEDYCNKVRTLLSDHKVYRRLNRNPTSGVEKKTSTLLKKSGLSPLTIKNLTPRESSAPKFYGLPKIHKEAVPLRPIVSNIGGPTYQLARYLTKPLQELIGLNDAHIKNSMDFVDKINKIRVNTGDILVSFDVVSLFTNVPIQDTLNIIKESKKTPTNLFPLIEHCLTSTYFQFQGEFFEQTAGAAMGSPISPIIANIFMEHLENKILKDAPLKPSTWFRYVDDTFVIWSHGRETLPGFLGFLNSQHPMIQFTMEVEQDNRIPFLDVLVQRNGDGTLGHRVYRKPTHTDRYLHATSHHHPSQKKSVISSLVYRALTIAEPTSLDEELKHLNQALKENGYSDRDFNHTVQRLKKKVSDLNSTETADKEKEKNKTAILPYLQGTTERIGRILRKYNIKVIFKPQRKISQLLPNPKDRKPRLETPGVYKIPCSCGKVYIGETGRKISTRIKEHERCTKYGHFSQSALAEHWKETGHSIKYDETTILAHPRSYFARKHREGLEIWKHPSNLNRDKGYQLNPIWHAALPVF